MAGTLGIQPTFRDDSVSFQDAQNNSDGLWNRKESKFLANEAWPYQECDILEAEKTVYADLRYRGLVLLWADASPNQAFG